MADSDTLEEISEDLKYLIKSVVPNSVYKNADNPDPGGGGGGSDAGIFKVTITESSGTYSADKTVEEILAAFAAGQLPVAVINLSGEYWYCPFSFNSYGDSEEDRILYFTNSMCSEDGSGFITMTTINIDSSGVTLNQVDK